MEVRNRYFIWKRHAPDAAAGRPRPVLGGCAFLLVMDLGCVLHAPMAGWRALAHAAGVAAGAAGCLLAPPRYEEPPCAAGATPADDFASRLI